MSITEQCRLRICQSFCPAISVTSSPDVDLLCRKLGASSLLHLLSSYSYVSGRITVRDSQAISRSFEDFTIRFIPGVLSNGGLGHAIHGDASSSHSNDYNSHAGVNTTAHKPSSASAPNLSSQNLHQPMDASAPSGSDFQLFDIQSLESYIAKRLLANPDDESIYLGLFEQVVRPATHQGPTPFETFNHPVAEVIAVSSTNNQPIETLSQLYSHSNEHIPPWVDPGYLRYYLLIYDESSDDLEKTVAIYEKMKRNFGLHCHMVKVRQPDLHPEEGQTEVPLPPITVDAINAFVRELTVQSVVPFMERNIALWNDQIASTRRGLAGRLFSAKKYFSSSRNSNFLSGSNAFGQAFSPLASNATVGHSARPINMTNGSYYSKSVSYPASSPEAQLRRLADFAFMLRDFQCAHNTYELLKKDYHRDKAWPYLAACQEMSVVSYLMLGVVEPGTSNRVSLRSLSDMASSLSLQSPGSTANPGQATATSSSPSSSSSSSSSSGSLGLSPRTRLDLLDPLLDSAVYSYISRCSLPTYALRAILLCSELLCGQLSPSAASDGATHWILKALNEKLAGRLAYALIMERMAGAYSAHDVNIKYLRDLMDLQYTSPSPASSSTVTSRRSSAVSRIKEDVRKEARGAFNERKIALWNLLSAREWHEAGQLSRAGFCLRKADSTYKDLPWTQSQAVLLGRLKAEMAT